jgi:hypothetical protein
MKRGIWPLTTIVFVKETRKGRSCTEARRKKERECDKDGTKIRLERPLYRGLCLLDRLNERGNWLSDALPLGLSRLLGMLPAGGKFLYDILTFEEHELPAPRCRAMSVRRRRQKAQRGLTPQMRPELVFPAEVFLAMGAFDPRTTVLGEVIVAV